MPEQADAASFIAFDTRGFGALARNGQYEALRAQVDCATAHAVLAGLAQMPEDRRWHRLGALEAYRAATELILRTALPSEIESEMWNRLVPVLKAIEQLALKETRLGSEVASDRARSAVNRPF